MKNATATQIAEVRNNHSRVNPVNNGRIAVVVSTQISARKHTLGVQFWTPEMIAMGTSTNTDRTVSTYVDHLVPATKPAEFVGMSNVDGEQFATFTNVTL